MQQPCQRHLGQRLAAHGRDVVQVVDLLELVLGQRAGMQESAVGGDTAVGGDDAVEIAVGQQALVERGERDQPPAQALRGLLEPVGLHRAVEDVVTVLVDDERHMQLVEDGGGLLQRRPVVVRQSHVQRLAAGHDLGERPHRLLKRRLRIHAVMVEDVHIVQSKPLQALVQRSDQILAAAEVAVRAGPHLIAGLGADDQLVAMRGEIRAQQLTHVALGGTGFRPVVVGQVEVGDAVVERGPGQLAHGLERRVVAEVVPAAQRDGRQLQAAVATAVVGHRVIARGRGRVGGGRFHHGGSPSNIRCRSSVRGPGGRCRPGLPGSSSDAVSPNGPSDRALRAHSTVVSVGITGSPRIRLCAVMGSSARACAR